MKKPTGRKILTVRNLSYSYNQHPVLDDMSFDIEEGSFTSILGPNGAGKSTLINVLSKVLHDFEGRITIQGNDITGLDSGQMARMVAVVPQYTVPGFAFTVEEMVIMGRFSHFSRFKSIGNRDLEIVHEVMEKTSVAGFADRRFDELSGGEKQRVVIAQALAQDSPLLLLDEPTSHLDINFQIEFINLFLKLNREENKTIIGVFHDINLAIQNSGRIILLKEGRIFASGSTGEIINRQNLRSVFHSDVFVGKNPITGKLYISPVFDTSYSPALQGDRKKKGVSRIHVIGGGGAASPIISLLSRHGYRVSCGVVNTFDTDLATAQMLEIPYVTEAPFSPVSDDSRDKNLKFIRSSDVVILPPVEFGHGNFSNLLSVKDALELGKKVMIMDAKDIESRDHTGGKATELYKKLKETGAITVNSSGELLDKLG
ncbi:MAG: ABC transporter ATP-binding protein [Actinobacteria bacterium]|nr:ABC transporter ATP-binding protein [Actinomycetota bacterium]